MAASLVLLGAAALAALLTILFVTMRFMRRPSIPTEWRRVGTVGHIYCYPVKSCKGISVEQAECKKNGVHYDHGRDRAFVVVEEHHDIVSCKLFPNMLLIEPNQEGNVLTLKYPNHPDVSVDLDMAVKANVRSYVEMNVHKAPGIDLGDEIASWLEDVILEKEEPGKKEKLCPLRMLYMAPNMSRKMPLHERTLANFDSSHMVNYAGTTSYLVVGEGTVQELKEHMKSRVDERPFRPSLYIAGTTPREENEWKWMKINGAVFQASITCARCPVVNTDPDRGAYMEEKPLDVVRRYRKEKDPATVKYWGHSSIGPIFGHYYMLRSDGRIKVGDEVFAYP